MKLTARDVALGAIFAALTAIISQISIPFASGVPFTLQTFMIQLLAFLLGARLGTLTTVLYLLLGAIGLPVFAQMTGGLQILVGPTGGFLLSFPLMVVIIGVVLQRTNQFLPLFLAALVATFINLLIGTGQFMLVSQVSFSEAMLACFWPFVFFGVIKAGLAVFFGQRLQRHKAFQSVVLVR
ncbi:MAG: biotin transporter BioY [Culicoidibacterales bacterium]